jgi:predicted glycogen debranching enzyme
MRTAKSPLPNRTIRFDPADSPDTLLNREWLLTNGTGGYASGTVANVPTRRYHGLLIAALPSPMGRTMMLHHLSELILLESGQTLPLGGIEPAESDLSIAWLKHLREFRLDGGLPTWLFDFHGTQLEKQIVLIHEQNTVHVNYRLVQGKAPVRLDIPLFLQPRGHDESVNQPPPTAWTIQAAEDRYELHPPEDSPFPQLKLFLHGESRSFTLASQGPTGLRYRVEQRRGYPFTGELWSPGHFGITIAPNQPATLIASTEAWESILALSPPEAIQSARERADRLFTMARKVSEPCAVDELIMAADQFLIKPVGRTEDAARMSAEGDEMRTVIAGYPWFTDWGRDTMISLEGLTLVTGRFAEAGFILRAFAHHIRNGLIPNSFPEGESEGIYHTADATLWFFHALDRYIHYSQDQPTLRQLLPRLSDIIEHHLQGTRFDIRMDPEDGLLSQGEEGYPLTWMDAHVDDWVVTPRRGKAVEINALWYNALRLMSAWIQAGCAATTRRGAGPRSPTVHAPRFNRRFWCEQGRLLVRRRGRRAGRRLGLPPQPIAGDFAEALPCSTGGVGNPSSKTMSSRSACSRRWVCGRSRPITRITAPDTMVTSALATRPIIRGLSGAWLIGPFLDAWLKLHPG